MADDDIAAILAELEASGSEEEEDSTRFIGVPKGYTRPEQVRRRVMGIADVAMPFARNVAPRYAEGAQYDPGSLSATRIAEIQQALFNAGLYASRAKFRLGVWDEETTKAYKKVLSFANQQGTDWQDALERLRSAPMLDDEGKPYSPGGGGDEDELPVFRVSNPDDLREQLRIVGRTRRGRHVDEGFIERVVANFMAEEERSQRALATAAPGSTVREPRDWETFMEQSLRGQYGSEIAAQEAGELGMGAMNALGSLDAQAEGFGV